MTTLQASFGVFEQLADYGILGLLTLGLGFVVWWLLRRQLQGEDQLRTQTNTLQDDLNNYVREDRDRLSSALTENTRSLIELQKTVNNFNNLLTRGK